MQLITYLSNPETTHQFDIWQFTSKHAVNTLHLSQISLSYINIKPPSPLAMEWEQMPFENTPNKSLLQPSVSLWQVSDDYVNLTADKIFLFLFPVYKDRTHLPELQLTWIMSIKQVCTVRKCPRNCDADTIQSSISFVKNEAGLFHPGGSRTAQRKRNTECTRLASLNLQHPSNIADKQENGKAQCSWYEPAKDGKRIITCPLLMGNSEMLSVPQCNRGLNAE